MPDLLGVAIGAVGGLALSTGFLLTLFIGFIVIAGFTKFRKRRSDSLVVRNLAEKMGFDANYLASDAPRGPVDQLRTPELSEQIASVASGNSSLAKPPSNQPSPASVIAGKTSSAAAKKLAPKLKVIDDSSPLMSRRGWMGLAWGSFTAATTGCLAATGRFLFPNVLNEPPQQFTIGFPDEYGEGVDERWKNKFGVWIVRTAFDSVHEAPGFYALYSTCTHLGCTPNWLSAESKFKCPCHGSGFRPTGINFEGPAPRPLERLRIVLSEDGQILIDKSKKFQEELGQWTDPESFLEV